MRESQAYIERIRRVNRDYQRLDLAVDASLSALLAGQSLLARRVDKDYERETWHPYLRERWFPVAYQGSNVLTIEMLARQPFSPGQLFSLMGPVGKPLRFRLKLRNILLIAYETAPIPLLMSLPALLERQVSVTLALLGSARAYDSDHLPGEVEIIRADDDLSWSDMVMTLGWADQILAAVDPGDELARFAELMRLLEARRHDVPANYIFGLSQRALPCGVGACQACMLQSRDGRLLACLDGPAFDLTRLRLN